jgi:hypothetical protein
MTEETRKQLQELAAECTLHDSYESDCSDCCRALYQIMSAYELGEKAGRSAQKEEDDQAATS